MVYIIPNFLVIHFAENFMKIRSEIAKLQIHENLHKNVNENMFSFTFYANFHEFNEGSIKAKNLLQLYTANFDQLKMAGQYRFFQILMVQMFFSQIQQAAGPDQNGRKIPV